MLCGMIRSGEAKASGDEIIACIYGAKGELGDEEEFSEEKSWAAFIDARTAGDMARKVQSGKGFPFEAFSCTNYTNLVQYLGIGSGAEEEMRNYILEFMQYVLSEDKQQSLMELGLIPAVATKNRRAKRLRSAQYTKIAASRQCRIAFCTRHMRISFVRAPRRRFPAMKMQKRIWI